jgi:hypothetical protein
MKSMVRGLFALSILFASQVASAEQINYDTQKVSLTVPDGWSHADAGNGVLSILDPNKEVAITILGTEPVDAKAVGANVTGILNKMVTKLKIDKGKKANVHGLAGTQFKGTAQFGPKPVTLVIYSLAAPTGKRLLVISLAETKKVKGHAKDITATLESMAPIADAAPAGGDAKPPTGDAAPAGDAPPAAAKPQAKPAGKHK